VFSPGNMKLRSFIASFAASYSAAQNKEQKSKIVSTIISLIEETEGGAFVKFEEGAWWKVDEVYAREKIGNLFRDALHSMYRSSSKAKHARRKNLTACSGRRKLDIPEDTTTVDEMDPLDSSSTSSGMTGSMIKRTSVDSPSSSGYGGMYPLGWPMCTAIPISCWRPLLPYTPSRYDGHLQHGYALDRRSLVLNICSEALGISSMGNSMGMNTSHRVSTVSDTANLVSRPASLSAFVDLQGAFLFESLSKRNAPAVSSSTVSDDDDMETIATFADDDIFNDFRDSTTNNLSDIFN
jgi:hypothetical protein